MIYAVSSIKGGTGKSTIAAHLAAHWAKDYKVLLIDGDPQLSMTTWHAWRMGEERAGPSPTVAALRGRQIYDDGQTLAKKFDVTVIDAGGHDGPGLRNALLLAQRVITPMSVSGIEATTFDQFMRLWEEVSVFNRDLTKDQIRIAVNRTTPHQRKGRTIEEFTAEHEVGVIPTKIGHRSTYSDSISDGLTVWEARPRVAAATVEMDRFLSDVEAWR